MRAMRTRDGDVNVGAVWVNRRAGEVIEADARPAGDGWQRILTSNPQRTAAKWRRKFDRSERQRVRRNARRAKRSGRTTRCYELEMVLGRMIG